MIDMDTRLNYPQAQYSDVLRRTAPSWRLLVVTKCSVNVGGPLDRRTIDRSRTQWIEARKLGRPRKGELKLRTAQRCVQIMSSRKLEAEFLILDRPCWQRND
jgi:hypothetical protein